MLELSRLLVCLGGQKKLLGCSLLGRLVLKLTLRYIYIYIYIYIHTHTYRVCKTYWEGWGGGPLPAAENLLILPHLGKSPW